MKFDHLFVDKNLQMCIIICLSLVSDDQLIYIKGTKLEGINNLCCSSTYFILSVIPLRAGGYCKVGCIHVMYTPNCRKMAVMVK